MCVVVVVVDPFLRICINNMSGQREQSRRFSRSGTWWVDSVTVRVASPNNKGKMDTSKLLKVQSSKPSTNALNVAAAVGPFITSICQTSK